MTTTTKPAIGARLVAPLVASAVLNPINSTMIAVALVPIGRTFDAGPAETAWLITSLYLATAIGQPIAGVLVDKWGPRRVLLAGAAAVAAAGLAGTFALSLDWLIGVRMLLGFGTCAGFPAAMAVLRRQSDATGAGVPAGVLAVLSISAQTIMVIGPTLGGALIGFFGWPAIFAVNIPLAVGAMVLAWLWLPSDRRVPGARSRLDVRGVLTNGPILRTYLRQALAFLAIYTIMFGYVQWLQADRGLSEVAAGLLLLPMSVVAMTAAALSGRASGLRARLVLSVLALAGGSGLLLLVQPSSWTGMLVAVAAMFGLAQGLTSVTNQTALYSQAAAGLIGTASGLFRTAQYIGAMASSALIAVCFGEHPSAAGLHRMAAALLLIAVALLVVTLIDRGLRQRSRTT
ncbi:MFS family permease [Saccharomonospora amisosensis]|uniref:MFS family permease n=1 Tax=Saccharomonospora amisosensis TaxID=1128677 RepID=A0A7X5USA2_9PSEU|nr:MFS transporter [Saccharomonospora amisosensis]NIJ13291.1 MFS family permease [Saccharomonospora amisosensis]